MNTLARIRFFAERVHHPEWKKSMAGKNENGVIEVLEGMGYVEDKDFVRQHPIGERFVIDFAFVKEQVAIEVDGTNHDSKKQKSSDKKRDKYLFDNNWVSIRIKDREFFGYKKSFYKNFIKEIVEERREQWIKGNLFAIDIPNFNEKDYE